MKEISFIQVLPLEKSSIGEVIEMISRMKQGIDVDVEHLALDVIDRVGPGGNYLVDEHTLAHFKQGYWEPKFMDRQNYENWVKQGSKTYGERIKEKVKQF